MKRVTLSLLLVFVFLMQTISPVFAASVADGSSDKFNYTYFEDGNVKSVYVGENIYSNYDYTDNSQISSIKFANEQSIAYDYDNNDRVVNVYYDDIKAINYDYSNCGEVGVESDYISDRMTSSHVDDSYTVNNMTTGKELFRIEKKTQNIFDFNVNSDVISRNTIIDSSVQNMLEYEMKDHNCMITIHYDSLGRVIDKTVKSGNLLITSNFQYMDDSGDYVQSHETYIYGETMKQKHTWKYEYDSSGNVISRNLCKENMPIKSDTFKYNNNNEITLISDNNKKTTKIDYDNSGNIIKTTKFEDNTITDENLYQYSDESWKDKLTEYDNLQISYDAVGNPISYNHNSYKWTAGRRLQSLNMVDNLNVFYFYDELGHRTRKIVKKPDLKIEYEYFWLGDTLIAMTIDGLNENKIDTVYFLYDFDGNLYGFIKNGIDLYLYETTATGDVIAIYNENGIVANYDYDDFGNIITSHENDSTISYYSPFYYRSYFYDIESKMYYLLSRYYIPEWGRFLNGDAYFSTGVGYFDSNMFAYCDNNFTNFSDPYGYWKKEDHREWSNTIALNSSLSSDIANAIGEGSYSVDIDMSTNPLRDPVNWKYNQRFHFDRRNYCDHISGGEDTRVYYANIYTNAALAKKASGDNINAAKLLGQALHFLQDVSSHGNVGINSSVASHGSGFDDPKYEWENTNRNSVYKVSADYQYEGGPKGYSSRYSEVLQTTLLLIVLYKTKD